MIKIESVYNSNFSALYDEAAKTAEKYLRDDLSFLFSDYSYEHLERIKSVARWMRENSEALILIGVGGSNGAARAVMEALKDKAEIEIIYSGNSLSPIDMKRLLNTVKEKDVSVAVIAKNFTTLEPGLHFRMVRAQMERKYDDVELAKRIAVIGSPGSLLNEIADEIGAFFMDFEPELTGRFSAFNNVGIFPLAVAGIDIDSYLSAKKHFVKKIKNFEIDDVIKYVCFRQSAYREGKSVEILSSCDLALTYFNKWWVQLFGESEGTDKKGIYPDSQIFSEDLHSMGQFIQAGSPIFMETVLSIESYDDIYVSKSSVVDDFEHLEKMTVSQINSIMRDASVNAHSADSTPLLDMRIDRLNEYSLGELFMFFMTAVVISAHMTGMSPFEQYGVEAYKKSMFSRLRGESPE